jgi:hypothetical protein
VPISPLFMSETSVGSSTLILDPVKADNADPTKDADCIVSAQNLQTALAGVTLISDPATAQRIGEAQTVFNRTLIVTIMRSGCSDDVLADRCLEINTIGGVNIGPLLAQATRLLKSWSLKKKE